MISASVHHLVVADRPDLGLVSDQGAVLFGDGQPLLLHIAHEEHQDHRPIPALDEAIGLLAETT
jgi:hypothetical protein